MGGSAVAVADFHPPSPLGHPPRPYFFKSLRINLSAAQAFVRTIKRDYVRASELPDAKTPAMPFDCGLSTIVSGMRPIVRANRRVSAAR